MRFHVSAPDQCLCPTHTQRSIAKLANAWCSVLPDPGETGFTAALPSRHDFLDFRAASGVTWFLCCLRLLESNMRYLFEDFALDVDRRELFRGTDLVSVEPQVFDLLLYLIQNRKHVVSRDDLFASVWKGRTVSESALSTRLNAARSTLGDSGEEQRLIKTLPRKGVRFVGAVREEPSSVVEVGAIQSPLSSSDKPSIAVLPFESLSGDPEQDYFTDGIVEDITTALSRNRAFFVIARNSSFTYKSRPADTRQVARELGVRYVLEGSVRKAGGRVRVGGQLIEAASGHHLWADRFDGEMAEIFELQDQIVTRVVGAIAPQLEKAEIDRAKRGATDDLAAYDLYLRGLDSWNRWTKEENAKALQLFYAAMDSNLAIAWQRSGWVRGYAGDSDGAIESLKRAIRLNPLDPRVFLTQSAMAFAHFIAGRDDNAAEWAAMALRGKPNWPPALRVAIASNAMRGQADEVDRALNLYFRIDPKVSIARICEYYPLRRDVDRQRLVLAMRTAGVPE